MDGPGISMFQCSGMSMLQGPNQRQEEDEFMAEENELKAELNNLIDGAFDDLIDDEDDVSVSSGFSHERYISQSSRGSRHTSYEEPEPVHERNVQENFAVRRETNSSFNGYHCSQHRDRQLDYGNGSTLDRYKESDLNGFNQLKVLYEVRLKEIERLTTELQAEKSKKEQILKRLDTVEKEKNGIFGTLNSNQEVLVKSKDKIIELEREVERLRNELKEMEKAKNETKRELDLARMQIIQLEQQMTLMERCDSRLNREKQIDEVIETLNAKHKKELMELQKDLDLALEKILKKDEACQLLEKKLDEMEKKHVATLLNRCDSVAQQDDTVRALLKQSDEDKERLTAKIASLQNEVDSLRGDLSQFDSVAKMRLFDSSPSDSSDGGERDSAVVCSSSGGGSSRRRLMTKLGDSSSVPSDLVGKLKDELHRALIGQQAKREEIKKLQQNLLSKEIQINKMREQEKSYLTESDQLKADMLLILEKLDRTNASSSNEKDEQLNAARKELAEQEVELSSARDKLKDLEAQVELLQSQLNDERLSAKRHAQEYSKFFEEQLSEARHESKVVLSEKEKEWKQKFDAMQAENDEVKRLYLEVHSSKELLTKKLNDEETKSEELTGHCEKLKQEIERLQNTVNSLENHILSLTNERSDKKTSCKEDSVTILALKEEIEKLKSEARPSETELLELKTQVADARARYVRLERTLKDEFEASVSKLKAENDRLKEEVAKTAQEVESLTEELARKQTPIADSDISCVAVGDSSCVSHMDIVNQLEAEVDRLKALELNQAEEICRLKSDFQKRLQERLEEAETALWDKHRKEVDAATTQAKTVTAQFFAGKLQEERERFEEALKVDREKIEELRKEIGIQENQLKENEEVKERLTALQRDSDEYKRKANGLLKHWAAELQSIKEAKEAASSQLEEARSKIDRLKKAALKYKKMYEQIREASLPEKYQALVALVSVKEKEIIEKIEKIEEYYKTRAPALIDD